MMNTIKKYSYGLMLAGVTLLSLSSCDDYFDDVDDYCEQWERAEELTEFNRTLFEQIDWEKIERMTR